MKKVYLATDHAGFELKNSIKEYIESLGYQVIDTGAHVYDSSDDYPDYINELTQRLTSDEDVETAGGVIFGGSGTGEAIVANKKAGIRAGLFYGTVLPKTTIDVTGKESVDLYEIVRLGRKHNNINVLSLGARFLTLEEAKHAVSVFLETEFVPEERHVRRIAKYEIHNEK